MKFLEWSKTFENLIINSFCYGVIIKHRNKKMNKQALFYIPPHTQKIKKVSK